VIMVENIFPAPAHHTETRDYRPGGEPGDKLRRVLGRRGGRQGDLLFGVITIAVFALFTMQGVEGQISVRWPVRMPTR